MKILCVDDKSESLYLLELILRQADYEVEIAHSGVEALEKLKDGPFNLIISDILMPRMDGFEFCHEVKTRAEFRDVPFIFYTATYTDSGDEALGKALGPRASSLSRSNRTHSWKPSGRCFMNSSRAKLGPSSQLSKRKRFF